MRSVPSGDVSPVRDAATFSVTSELVGHSLAIRVTGELDLAHRDHMFETCTNGAHQSVTVDMSELTFMDCAGYGAIAAARLVLQRRGGRLDILNVSGEPARLLVIVNDDLPRIC